MNKLWPWTTSRIARLREMWADDAPASEIADTLGHTTRNAVIGKAHRLGLPARQSPIGGPTPGWAGPRPKPYTPPPHRT